MVKDTQYERVAIKIISGRVNDYLDNEKVYLALESFLKDYFLSFVRCDKAVDCPYYNTFFSNGKPFMDGDPIFSARKKIMTPS